MNISSVLWLVPFLPMAGFLFLALFGTKIPRKMVPVIGAGTIGLAALITLIIGIDFLQTRLRYGHRATSVDMVQHSGVPS